MLLPLRSEAASIFFEAKDVSKTSSLYLVSVMLDTEGENDNAFSGEISVPSMFEIADFSYTDSVVTSWVVQPKAENQKIQFSGITAGGFRGVHDPFAGSTKPGSLFHFYLKAKESGSGKIFFDNVSVLQNDGKATPDHVTTKEINLWGKYNAEVTVSKDTEPPKEFTPTVSKSASIFNGKYFLAFDTIDNTGVKEFYVEEGNRRWIVAHSPYLLKDQSLQSNIRVKAVDNAGNERIALIEAKVPERSPFSKALFTILFVLVLGVWIYKKKNEKKIN